MPASILHCDSDTAARHRRVRELERYLLSMFRDLTERRRAEAELRRQAGFDELMARVLSEFVTCPAAEIGAAVDRALGRVAAFFGADHVLVYELQSETNAWPVIREWRTSDLKPIGTIPSAANHLPFWRHERLFTDADLAADAQSAALETAFDLEWFRAEGATSVLNAPIKGAGGIITGRIGLHRHGDPAPWPPADAARVRIVGNTIAGILERKRAEDALRESVEELRSLADNSPVMTLDDRPRQEGCFLQ